MAFGFYGIDIGDFGGQLVLNLIGESTRQVTVSNTVGTYGSTDGSVLYFGIIANNPEEYFTSVLFHMSTGEGDFFAFDNMTFGNIQNVVSTVVPVVEPQPPVAEPQPPVAEPQIPTTEMKVSIDEPSSVFGVMALGAMAAGSLLLRKQQRR